MIRKPNVSIIPIPKSRIPFGITELPDEYPIFIHKIKAIKDKINICFLFFCSIPNELHLFLCY